MLLSQSVRLTGLLLLLSPCTIAAGQTAYVPRPQGELSFSKHIAPVVFQNCAACHRPGEVAPFSLLTFRDVSKRAEQIADVVEQRIMPPWKPVAGHGEFLDARTLSADEIGMLRQWAAEGAREGDPGDLPPQPKFTPGWQLGEPHQIVTMSEAYEVPSEGRDIYRNFVLPMQVPEGKYIQAVEYRPGNRRVVHHAILSYDTSGRARERDEQDSGPGFTSFAVVGKRLPGSTGFWTPGRSFVPLGEGFSFAWPAGADLVLQLHVHPSGKPEKEQSTIGFYYSDEPPRRTRNDLILIDRKIDIPPGEAAYRTHDAMTLPADVSAYAIFPHMHIIGKEVRVTAELPDGGKQDLLWINDWNFNWQEYYHYTAPVKLPKGTRITMDCTHDNSTANPNNPRNPPQRVRWGEQSFDEMSLVFLEVAPDQPGTFTPPKRSPPTAEQLAAFVGNVLKQFDRDGDDKLSLDELVTATAGRQTRETLEKQLARFDKDSDGKLDKQEATEAVRAIAGR